MMNQEDPIGLIKKGESETVEFKSSLTDWREIVETVSAFSNTKGGTVQVGVQDDGRIIGVNIGKDTLEKLANQIKQNTDPPVYPSIVVKKQNGKNVVILQVSECEAKPVFAFGRAFKRVGRSNQRLGSEEIRRLLMHYSKISWDERICMDASLKDIDAEKVRWFLKAAKEERNLAISKDASLKVILMKLNLLKKDKLTNAAVVLFGKNPQKYFIQAQIKGVRFKGTKPVKPFLDMKSFGGNIIDQIDNATRFILEHIPRAVWLAGNIQREEKYQYPPDALREGVVNAICHRDYASGGEIHVRIFDDRIELWNPGELPVPLTLDDLRKEHKSIPRNPLIAEQLFWIKYIEKVGSGTNDMIQYCSMWGIPEPEFKHITGDFVVLFRGELTEEYLKDIGLNERQRKAIVYLQKNQKITSREYRGICKVSKDTMNRDFGELLKKELIERKGRGAHTFYVLKDIVRYRPISSDQQSRSSSR